MDNILFQSYKIEERSYVSFIKREIHNLIKSSFNEQRTGEIDIVVSEMTSNLIKHVGRGELLYRLAIEDEEPVFEILCIDSGAGIKDLAYSLKDGNSTKNTLGQGLGSITRLSNFSQIFSLQNWGTIIYSKFHNNINYKALKKNVLVRCINLAKPVEKVSGDGAYIRILKDKTIIFCGDGLGHGEYAKQAVDKAISELSGSMLADPAYIIKEINLAVKKTRGLVATVAVLDHSAKLWQICGVGNIHTRLQKGLEYKTYICNNGIVGLNIPTRLQNADYEMERLQLLILCSDGIKIKWDLARYPGILKYDPMIIAAVLYKDHARHTDDMTILVTKVI